MRQLELEAGGGPTATEPLGIGAGGGPRPVPIADPQPAGDLALATTRQGDDSLVMGGEQLLAEARHRLRPVEVRPRDQPAEASIADQVAGQQDEVRAALPLADPPLVLLDGLAMTGQPSPLRSWPVRPTLPGARFVDGRGGAMTAPTADGPPIGDDDPIGVRHDRVAELDLDPDDRPEPGLLEGRRRPDDPVETLVIGDREAAQPELGRPLGQLVRGRRAIEEREVGMAVELGVGGHRRTENDRTCVRFCVGDSTILGRPRDGKQPFGSCPEMTRNRHVRPETRRPPPASTGA
jgi:hypothetical protein